MKEFFKTIHFNHKNNWNKESLLSLMFGLVLFVIALILQKFANDYLLAIARAQVYKVIHKLALYVTGWV